MQNKGPIRIFAILLALVCAYQLMFSVKVRQVENEAGRVRTRRCQSKRHFTSIQFRENLFYKFPRDLNSTHIRKLRNLR